MPAFRDLTGQTFNRLTVLERGPNRGKHIRWWCVCDCGTKTLVSSTHLVSGHTKSCRCYNDEQIASVNMIHGLSHTPEYTVWYDMNRRCSNPMDIGYKDYGGRGIVVCASWRVSFEAFLADMGPRPGIKYSLDRVNNDGPYEKDNCRWTTWAEQRRNTRRNRFITLDGHTACLKDWLHMKGLSDDTFRLRLKHGFSIEEALTMPLDLKQAQNASKPRKVQLQLFKR